jgi:hypothetical protein
MKSKKDLKKELIELREMVNQSSEHTQRQLQVIDSNLLIVSLLSLISVLGVSFLFDILVYWIPASFLLIYAWALLSLLSLFLYLKRNLRIKNINETTKETKPIDMDDLKLQISWLSKIASSRVIWLFKVALPWIEAMGIVYLITFISLILVNNNKIRSSTPITSSIPAISAFILFFLSLFSNKVVDYIEEEVKEGKVKEFIEKLLLPQEKAKLKVAIGKFIFLFFLFYVIVYFGLPYLAFQYTRNVIINIWLFILVFILECITIIMFASYFNGVSAKKELANSITNFSNLNYLINDLLLNEEEINENSVQDLKKMFLTAKQYDIIVVNYFGFINIFYPVINSVYLKRK